MKDIWIERYRKSSKLATGEYLEVLTGFNGNIDVVYDVKDIEINLEDVESEEIEEVKNHQDLKTLLKFCMTEGENKEVKKPKIDNLEFENGEENVGGQGAIMANYLTNMNNSVVFYTPFLSDELIEKLEDDILYPVMDDQFMLKNVKDSSNTDRTKKNLIYQFSGDKTGRLILSDDVKGFGPYFRGGVADNFYKMDENLDRILLSGFHNIEGNMDTKLEKSKEQLSAIETPIHLEYVSMPDKIALLITKKVFPEINSIGCDEFELRQLASLHNIELNNKEHVNILDAYKVAKTILEEYDISRFHLHTYRYHLVVTPQSYDIEKDKIRDSMMFGVLSSITMAEIDKIPRKEDLEKLNWDNLHLRRLDELEEFSHNFDLENFVETGIGEVEEYNVVAVPSIIHESPKRLVGMGDIMSAGAFIGEIK